MGPSAGPFVDHPCASVGTSHPENKQRNTLRGNRGSGQGIAELQRGSSPVCAFPWDSCAPFCLAGGFSCTLEASPRTSELASSRARGASNPSCGRPRADRGVLGCCGGGRGATDRRREGSGPSSRQPQAAAGEARRSPRSWDGSCKRDLGAAQNLGTPSSPGPSANSRLTIYLTCCGWLVSSPAPLIRGNKRCSVQ